ncbi:MAG: hypothetical protein D6812_11370 [Deltaproteobacteria bacterium]|nr:MAG: hypothetical protein D6812_11370 [Deltaproteobacteria bacterium]
MIFERILGKQTKILVESSSEEREPPSGERLRVPPSVGERPEGRGVRDFVSPLSDARPEISRGNVPPAPSYLSRASAAGDAEEERLWDEIVDDPQDRKRHQAYIGYCLRAQQLPIAIRRYNQIIQDYGQDATLLHFRTQVISILQFTHLGASRGQRGRRKKDRAQGLGCMAIGVSLFLILIGTLIGDPSLAIFRLIGFALLVATCGYFLYRFFFVVRRLKREERF